MDQLDWPGVASVFIDSSPGEPSTFNPLVSEDATSGGFIGLFLDSLVHNSAVTGSIRVLPSITTVMPPSRKPLGLGSLISPA
ncbi:MAG: hypothetical protein NTV17_06130 [Burkholderiales bacterium]|nr:hypothetical protein [Burkholderiales bacterium]